MTIHTLDKSALQDILSTSRARGVYDGQLREFVESGEAGGEVDTSEGIFKDKKSQTLKTGFDSAKERWLKLADVPEVVKSIEIRSTGGKVYLIRTDLL